MLLVRAGTPAHKYTDVKCAAGRLLYLPIVSNYLKANI
jgi:hypothetical protein